MREGVTGSQSAEGVLLPDVLPLHLSFPVVPGLKVARIAKQDHPQVRAITMSAQYASALGTAASSSFHFLNGGLPVGGFAAEPEIPKKNRPAGQRAYFW
jgi:hypothetical protein